MEDNFYKMMSVISNELGENDNNIIPMITYSCLDTEFFPFLTPENFSDAIKYFSLKGEYDILDDILAKLPGTDFDYYDDIDWINSDWSNEEEFLTFVQYMNNFGLNFNEMNVIQTVVNKKWKTVWDWINEHQDIDYSSQVEKHFSVPVEDGYEVFHMSFKKAKENAERLGWA